MTRIEQIGVDLFWDSSAMIRARLRHPRLRLWTNQCGNKRSRLFNKSWPRSDGCPFRV